MRALFLALILANLVFFFWEYTLAPSEPAPTRPAAEQPDENVPPLVLLNGAHKANPAAAPKPKEPKNPPEPSAGQPAPAGGSASQAPPPKAPAKAAKAMACYIVGPFGRPDDAHAAVTVLQAKGLEAGFEQRQAEKNRYWLHTPVLPTRKEALARMDDIKAAGIHDMALMRSGDFKNSISLGFYHNEASAKRRLAALKAKRIDAVMETEHRTVNTYWARYAVPRDNPAADAAWRTITAAHPDIQREGLPCR